MKPILAVALLAFLGFAVAGCGSGKKANTGQYTVTLHNNVPYSPITVTGAETTATPSSPIPVAGAETTAILNEGGSLTVGESVKLPRPVMNETEVMFLTH